MLIKKVFNPIRVIQYLKFELLLSITLSVLIYLLYSVFNIQQVSLPFSIAAILGSGLAIFIAFRNNSSYGRWWEARTLWGGIINSSRVFARLIVTFTDSHQHQANFDAQRSEMFKKNLIHLQIAWAHALRLHLRKQDQWQTIKSYMNEEDYQILVSSSNKPNMIQLIMGKHIYQAMSNGTLGGFDSFQLEGQLLALANYQGGCERIKNTPLLRQYHFFTKLFLVVFMAVLPFSLIGDFQKINLSWMMIPVSVLISFVFSVMAKVGEVNEDPFENKITDVPLSSMCNTIERDLKETLGLSPLPAKIEAENGILF